MLRSLNHLLRSQLFERIKSLPMTTLDDQRIGDCADGAGWTEDVGERRLHKTTGKDLPPKGICCVCGEAIRVGARGFLVRHDRIDRTTPLKGS